MRFITNFFDPAVSPKAKATAGEILLLLAAIGAFFLAGKGFTRYATKLYMIDTIEQCEEKNDVIFGETQNGSFLFVPINADEAALEMSGPAGESLTLWLSTGNTVTVSDDVLVTNQVNMYKMLYAVINRGQLTEKNGNYVATINDVENIHALMTEDWRMSEGQVLGSLSCYDEDLTSDMSMELIVSKDGEDVYFDLNLFVDNTGYKLYRARFIEQSAELPSPDIELYNLNGVNTLSADQNAKDAYAQRVIGYFYKLAVYLDVEELTGN